MAALRMCLILSENCFTTFCIKPSQFTDDPDSVGRLCREIVRRVEGMLGP